VITLLYLWWSERCGVREGEQQRDSGRLAHLTSTYAAEWSSFKPVKEPGSQAQVQKIMEATTMIRECDGGVISSGYGKLENIGEAFHAEIIACLQVLQRAADLGIQRVLLETDASMVVQAAKSAELERSSASGLIWELKDLLASNFAFHDVIHTPRSGNMAADGLAALGASLSSGAGPIMDSIPICIRVLVTDDLAAVYE